MRAESFYLMAEPFLIIDGYNLMHAAGMARLNYGPGELEKWRNRFLTHLARHLHAAERARTTIVFDAGDAPADLPRKTSVEYMRIVFTLPGGDADSTIEELIASHSAPRQVRLVSSDHRLQKAARRRRATFVDSEQFAAELEQRGSLTESANHPNGRPQRSDPKFTGQVSQEETEAWLEVFADVPEAAELENEAEHWQSLIDELSDDDDSPDEQQPKR